MRSYGKTSRSTVEEDEEAEGGEVVETVVGEEEAGAVVREEGEVDEEGEEVDEGGSCQTLLQHHNQNSSIFFFLFFITYMILFAFLGHNLIFPSNVFVWFYELNNVYIEPQEARQLYKYQLFYRFYADLPPIFNGIRPNTFPNRSKKYYIVLSLHFTILHRY
mmetsp:Transcript_15889/g.31141  ORF Transcript_15889/g.31141 Transcript_15889/m.31141 type:complete len:162 (-) Transcript_15889:99-584(-)